MVLALLDVDPNRPWPLGVPSGDAVVELLQGRASVGPGLTEAHQKTLGLLPAECLASVRDLPPGSPDAVLAALVVTWRVVVAVETRPATADMDLDAVQALIQEAQAARVDLDEVPTRTPERGRALGALRNLLNDKTLRLVENLTGSGELPRVDAPERITLDPAGLKKEEPGATTSAAGGGAAAKGGSAASRVPLKVAAFFTVMAVGAWVHFGPPLEDLSTSGGEWLVLGDPASGEALLVPRRAPASLASLEAERARLDGLGFKLEPRPFAEWSIRPKQEGR